MCMLATRSANAKGLRGPNARPEGKAKKKEPPEQACKGTTPQSVTVHRARQETMDGDARVGICDTGCRSGRLPDTDIPTSALGRFDRCGGETAVRPVRCETHP